MESVADRPGHRDMAGDHQVERQARNLKVGQWRVEVETPGDERADQVVARLAFASLYRVEEVALQRDGSFCVAQPLLQRARPAGLGSSRCPRHADAPDLREEGQAARRVCAVGAARQRLR